VAETATSSRVREPRTIEITINGTPYVVSEREMTGAQLKELGHVPAGEALFLKHGDGREGRIEDDQTVKLHNHQAFESGPDGGIS
jgi:Multiubiquitin